MKVKKFSKSKLSEWVIRNALYWLSGTSEWSLEESDKEWIVVLEDDRHSTEFQLSRLINDYILRERMMLKTEGARSAIAEAVIDGIKDQLSK